ncbi:GyrI-like domain-containing protein [Paenibacillus tritici]|uniref:GyrI-like domain-containing protein n=1 Tax=Paenibacillus tritici TaxID=1873425 RepID=A0ABX2DMZ8_9BACL|nr:GyrI-like domain-containing protein [Paenibacillus tritici]NQX45987.1 GyrI-like domain-containing protein [Paenibacillus tritici]QUL58310.1 GyrI-like domain-containing protein [Paenibacillus tritici]
MKVEWRKQDKALYLPAAEPGLIQVPAYPYFMLRGEGNPNHSAYAEAVGVLYSLSYAVKMLPRKGPAPEGYYDYTVFPLEGVWDLSEAGRKKAVLDKDELVYNIMIRQPDFVTPELAAAVLEQVKRSKPHPLLEKAVFAAIEDGLCVQMLHIGPYDDEPHSFARMEQFCTDQGLLRESHLHREIYISDVRRTRPEKLKTVLRFKAIRPH